MHRSQDKVPASATGANEATNLFAHQEYEPELTGCEKVISYACVDVARPFRFFCSDGINRQFDDKIARKEKNIVIEQPTLAFRADARSPDKDNIFTNGLSVYSAERLIKKTFCDDPCCAPQWLFCLPFSLL